ELELRLEVDDEVPRWVSTDPIRLRQVLLNLLSNGVKFTDRGSVRLAVAVEPGAGETAGSKLRFTVHDTGIGIAHERLEHLFEPFTQGDDTDARLYPGTGLGLTLSRTLVERMGGELGARTEPAGGSVFWFTVHAPAVPPSETLDTLPAPGAGSGERRVLVVEDNPVNQTLARYQLERLGIGADLAANGLEALEILARRSYDLVLMDVQMPHLDGYRATAEIRRREGEERHTPIVAMTAHALPADRQRCLDAGMDDYLAKPVHLEDLARTLERWIEMPAKEALPVEPRPPATAAPPTPQTSPVDPEVLDKLRRLQARTGRDVLGQLIEIFEAEGPRRVRVLHEALLAGDMSSLAFAAHALKGSGGTLGARRLAELCQHLEDLAGAGWSDRLPAILARLDAELEDVLAALHQARWDAAGVSPPAFRPAD
ncbi:MAG: response regulator, partial [Acidobacteria bacterium]|nr:response regulator [Acidobacteriota bacterium]